MGPSGKGFLIYGAYGFTGELISKLALEKGLRPVLAGRNEKKLQLLAGKLAFPFLVFEISEKEKLDEALSNVGLVLHCAGPFSETTQPMLNACLKNGVHYLDITGEIEVFEYLKKMDHEARKAGIVILPGTGFDVVPTDCMAAYLKKKLPGATHLELAIKGANNISRGTALTMAQNIHKGCVIRQDAKLKKVPNAYKAKMVDFGKGSRLTVTIPWGDVSTAYYSTGIPNIKVYAAVSNKAYDLMKISRYMGWFLGMKPVQNYLKKKIKSNVTGPGKNKREEANSYVWGEVSNDKGERYSARLVTPEAYKLTSHTALLAAGKVLAGKVTSGFHTPSSAFGSSFILEIEGCKLEDVL